MMRSHRKIIADAGGATVVARAIETDPGKVKQWKRTDSIPGAYWAAVATAGFTSLEELAAHAEALRRRAAMVRDLMHRAA